MTTSYPEPPDYQTVGEMPLYAFLRALGIQMDAGVASACKRLDGNVDDLGLLYAALSRAVAQVKVALDQVEGKLLDKMKDSNEWEHESSRVPGLMLTRHSGNKRTKWQHDELISAVSHAIADRRLGDKLLTEDGEFVDPIKLVHGILEAFREAATPAWKVTGLRPLGIQPDQYCETEMGNGSIEIPKEFKQP